jgi:spermidine synthase
MAASLASKRPDTHFAVLFTVFTTGLSTMALQIALLFSFQSIYGFVYEMVGLIVAMFMGGLALGTLFTHRYIADKANLHTLARVQLLIALMASLVAVVLPKVAIVTSPAIVFLLFLMLTFVSGLINGVDFPLSAACCMALNQRAEKSAGTVYSMELFGACVGAALASALVAPILGIVACCLLAGIANGTAFVVLLICRRSYA